MSISRLRLEEVKMLLPSSNIWVADLRGFVGYAELDMHLVHRIRPLELGVS